jgi:hypothetical protein
MSRLQGSFSIVFSGLAGESDIASGEDQVGRTTLFAEIPDRSDQGFQDYVTVIGVSGADVEVRDVEPGDLHLEPFWVGWYKGGIWYMVFEIVFYAGKKHFSRALLPLSRDARWPCGRQGRKPIPFSTQRGFGA